MSRMNPTSATAIDLSSYPLPEVLETRAPELIFADMVKRLVELDPTYTVLVEGDPAVMLLELMAGREVLMRGRVNDGLKAVLLPTSYGNNLDALGARLNVQRLVVTEEDLSVYPPVERVMEDDDRYKERLHLAPEAWSGAGPEDAYKFQTKTATPRVKDVKVYNHASGLVAPGSVLVVFMAAPDDIPADVANIVDRHLQRPDIKPLTDDVIVLAAQPYTYEINAILHTGIGPDVNVIRANARASLANYIASRRKVGMLVAESGIKAALMVPNVEKITLLSPATDVEPGFTKYAEAISVDVRVVQDA